MAVIVVDVLRLAKSAILRAVFGEGYRVKKRLFIGIGMLLACARGTNRLGGLGATLDSVESAQSRIAGLRL
jgi:hypothetical protein